MLKFKKYISERDLWLERWIMECEKYLIESPGFDIGEERKVGLKSMAAFKRFLGSVSSNYGIEGFNFKSPQVDERIGAGDTKIEDFQELMQVALGIPEDIPLVAPTDSVTFQGITYTNDSKKYFGIPVVGLPKPKLMLYAGQDSRSGNTRIQELAFLYMLASKYYPVGGEHPSVSMAQFNHVANKIEEKGKSFKGGDKTTKDVYEFLTTNPAWLMNWQDATDTFMKKGYSTPIRFVKDSTSFELNKQAENLFKKDGMDDEIKWDSDKWNPADVWICYQNENILAGEFNGILDLNSKMKGYLDTKNSGIIGLSLKLGSTYTEVNPKTGGYEILDNQKSGNVKDSQVENGFKLHYGKFFGQSVYQSLALLDYEKKAIPTKNRHEIDYRLFTGKAGGPLVGEVKVGGTKAAHGKVYLEYIDVESKTTKISRTVKKATSKKVIEYDSDKERYVLTRDGKRIFRVVSFMWGQIKKGIASGIVDSKIRSRRKERVEGENNLKSHYDILEKTTSEFEDFLNKEDGILNDTSFKKLTTTTQKASNLNIKISTRFQTIAFGGWWCRLYHQNRERALSTALGMMHLAKSMNPKFSCSHAKIT